MHRGLNSLPILAVLSCMAQLCGCALLPGSSSSQSENAAQPPLLIYDTSWNNPRATWHDRRAGDPVPPGEFYVGLVATQAQGIETVMIHVARCGAKASEQGGYWLMLKGPFEPGNASKVVPLPVAVSVDQLLPWNEVNHLLITEVRAEGVKGKTFDYTDVSKVLAPRISNYCLTNP